MNPTNRELLDVFSECFDAALSTRDIQVDVEALKAGASSLDRARALLAYGAFANAVFEQRLNALRLGIGTKGFREGVVNSVRRFAQTHSLEGLSFEESRGSSALTLLWKFVQWQRKEERAKLGETGALD